MASECGRPRKPKPPGSTAASTGHSARGFAPVALQVFCFAASGFEASGAVLITGYSRLFGAVTSTSNGYASV